MHKTHTWTTPNTSYPPMLETLYRPEVRTVKFNILETEHMSRFSQDYNKNNIISERTQTTRFYSFDKLYWCDITINIRHIKYLDETEYYYIEYDIVFKNNHNNDKDYCDNSHPFNNNIFIKDIGGCIVAKNGITDSLVNYLLMGFEDLEHYCGNTLPYLYKSNIMKSLSLLSE